MTKFIVSARKYRPSTFDEVIGQDHVAKTLKNALQSGQLAHSFLFCGPRGVGKTTCARILAKVINCENPINGVEPCNNCSSCKSFNENASFNIIELDAASNNSVEHMRSLIEQVRFQPQHGTHKVFIIDEVHMLSSQAFNAFLKTLEEPPPYAIFILATTEKHKILPTILSRCQIFDFKRIQPSDVVQQLDYILKEEHLTADQEALHLIGQKADGAMRDALSIYDKIASASGDHISYRDVISNLNILDYDYYFRCVDAIIRQDMSGVMLILDDVISQGFEVDQFIQGLGSHMRDLLVCKDKRTLGLLDVSDKLKDRYIAQSELVSSSHLLSSLDILNQCDISLSRSTNKRLYTEIALSKITYLPSSVEVQIAPNGEKKKSVTKPSPKVDKDSDKENILSSHVNETIREKEVAFESSSNVKDTSSNPRNEVESESEKKSQTKATSKGKSSLLVNIDINSIVKTIKKDEEEKAAAQENLSIDGVEKIWNTYYDQLSSPSTISALSTCKKELEGHTLKLTVPSKLIQNMIQDETDLLEQLRSGLGTYDLIYYFIIDKSCFPEFSNKKKKVVLSEKDRFHNMLQKKPELNLLVNRLGLKKNNRD